MARTSYLRGMPHPLAGGGLGEGPGEVVEEANRRMGGGHGGGEMESHNIVEDEGPFLTLEEWMRAEERREAKQVKKAGQGGGNGRKETGGSRMSNQLGEDGEGTFLLTTTGHAESSPGTLLHRTRLLCPYVIPPPSPRALLCLQH